MPTRSNTAKNYATPVTPKMPWRVAEVYPLPGYILEVRFLDGTYGKIDLSQRVNSNNAGVFSVLKDLSIFDKVYVDYGVVTWPGEIDLAPDAMYEEIKKNGVWILKGFIPKKGIDL